MKKFAYNYEVFRPHHVLISNIIEMTGCETYLELGVYQGTNIKYVSKYCKKCIGVDISDEYLQYKDFEFYKMTTDDFF